MARTAGVNYAQAAGVPADARILVIDDEELAHKVLAPFFVGIDVVRAYCITQALEVMARTRIDAVVLDVGLPEGVGHKFIPQLRSGGAEIIVHTAFPSATVATESYALGARHMLDKTVEIAMLLPAVIAWVLETRDGRAPGPDRSEVAAIMRSHFLCRQLARMVVYLAICRGMPKREQEVLALTLCGFAQKRMAEWLENVCDETVRTHVKHLRLRVSPASHMKDLTAAMYSCIVPEREAPIVPAPTTTPT